MTGCSARSTAVGRLQRQTFTMGRPASDTPPSQRHQWRQRSPSCGAVWRTQRMQAGHASCYNHVRIRGSFFPNASSLAISEPHPHTHTHGANLQGAPARRFAMILLSASRRPSTDMAQFCAEAIPISGRWLPPLVRNHRSCCPSVHQTYVVHAARLFGLNLFAILTTSRSPDATWVSCSFPEHVKQGVSNQTETSKVLLVFLKSSHTKLGICRSPSLLMGSSRQVLRATTCMRSFAAHVTLKQTHCLPWIRSQRHLKSFKLVAVDLKIT